MTMTIKIFEDDDYDDTNVDRIRWGLYHNDIRWQYNANVRKMGGKDDNSIIYRFHAMMMMMTIINIQGQLWCNNVRFEWW